MKYMDINSQVRKQSISSLGDTAPMQNKTKSKVGFVSILPIIIIAVVATLGFIFKEQIKAVFMPGEFSGSGSFTKLEEADGRTNILILGSDRRVDGPEAGRAVLTDTILVASIGKLDRDVVLISIPRDLYVTSPKGYTNKINSVYAAKGIEDLEGTIGEVLGIPIHYHVMITFELFEEVVNILGGVDINVETTFTDYEYPIPGKEADTCGKAQSEIDELVEKGYAAYYYAPCRFETLNFTQGMVHMDGATALKYARSRHGNNNEDTDFARSKRQQNVILAIKDKATSFQTLVNIAKLKELYDAYEKNVETNIDFSTIQSFYSLSKTIDFDKVVSIVLQDERMDANEGGLLYHPTDTSLYGNQYVLIPQTGNYDQIHAYVQRYLFGNK